MLWTNSRTHPMSIGLFGTSRRGRTFTGCWTCRARKVKCDEIVPQCTPCQKTQVTCAGYDSRLVWVTSDHKTYKPHGRRFLNCESTWRGAPPFNSSELDHLISLSNAAEYVKSTGVQWDPETNIPFNAFPAKEAVQALPQDELIRQVPKSLSYGRRLKDGEAFLFQHYTQHVAIMMMPYKDRRNPWATSYSQAALHYDTEEQCSLYNGLLAQAATNLAHLDCSRERMQLEAEKHYAQALKLLRHGIENQSGDYASYLAAAMTLMMFEIYNGTNTWRTHMNGAWRYLKEQSNPMPWKGSDFAWASTQSLCLIKILSETTRKPKVETYIKRDVFIDYLDETHLAAVKERDDFGFTVGAPRVVLNCIADITSLAHKIKIAQNTPLINDKVEDIFSRLRNCREINKAALSRSPALGEDSSPFQERLKMEFHHVNAFISATYIYLYRSIYNLPPCDVRPFVFEVFDNIHAFFAHGDGNLTLWPGFIAAVEAYEESDLHVAKSWLDVAASVGMGNRLRVRDVVEEIWRIRDATSKETRKDKGTVAIDWRDVMQTLGLDILLV